MIEQPTIIITSSGRTGTTFFTEFFNQNTYQFPKWPKWGKEQTKKLNNICGELMEKFEYGKEGEWKQKVQNT